MVGTPSADARTRSRVPSSDPPSALTMTTRASEKCVRSPSAAALVTWPIVAALRKLGMPTTRSAVGALGGTPLVERYGWYVLISACDLETADRWFVRWGDLTVLFSRMLPIVRTFISVPAGVARMPLWRFTLFSIVGTVPWVMLLVWAGMLLGDNWQDLKHQLRGLDYVVAGVIVVGIALFVWRHLRTR